MTSLKFCESLIYFWGGAKNHIQSHSGRQATQGGKWNGLKHLVGFIFGEAKSNYPIIGGVQTFHNVLRPYKKERENRTCWSWLMLPRAGRPASRNSAAGPRPMHAVGMRPTNAQARWHKPEPRIGYVYVVRRLQPRKRMKP